MKGYPFSDGVGRVVSWKTCMAFNPGEDRQSLWVFRFRGKLYFEYLE